MTSAFFKFPLEHDRYVQARDIALNLLRSSPGAKTIALVGPTQSGKSVIFRHIVEQLTKEFHVPNSAHMPLVALTIATSQDGRISPKHLNLKLLKALQHPTWEHVGSFDELKHYRPSRGRDETSMRDAVETSLQARATRYMALDEAQHLTHTKSRELRSNVLQSIKCLAALEGTLFLSGGYELACHGLFDAAHFVGRIVILDFGPYSSCQDDFDEWERILKSFSRYVPCSPKDLLLSEASTLLAVTNGSFGLLEKILWVAHSLANGGAVTHSGLRAAFPVDKEREAIKRDIAAGGAVLARRDDVVRIVTPPKKPKVAPFKRKPNRNLSPSPRVASDD